MFPRYEIHQVTNGVHSPSWTCEPMKSLFDHHIPGWRNDPRMLRNVMALPDAEIAEAHRVAKADLLGTVRTGTGISLRPDVLTIGARREAPVTIFRNSARCG